MKFFNEFGTEVGQELCDLVRKSRILKANPLAAKEFLFEREGVKCFPRAEVDAITGKAKAGKTYLLSLVMAAAEKGEVMGLRRVHTAPLRVLWFDTEQSEDTTYDIMVNRIEPLVGSDSYENHLYVVNTRQHRWQERLKLLKAAMFLSSPDLVVVDGIRDLMADINDSDAAQYLMDEMTSLASEYNCNITCVLHQNKAVEDKNLRGAIGTELKNKAYEVYECQKDAESKLFSVSQTDTRKYTWRSKLYFYVNDDGLPMLSGAPETNAEVKVKPVRYNPEMLLENGRIDKAKLFRKVLGANQPMRASTLKVQVMQLGWIRSSDLYGRLLEEAIEERVVEKAATLNGEDFYKLTDPELIF